jgi:hypothetical protein
MGGLVNTPNEIPSSLGPVVTRWQRWATAGIAGIKIDVCDAQNLDQRAPILIA